MKIGRNKSQAKRQQLSWLNLSLMLLVVLMSFALLAPQLSTWLLAFNSILLINFFRCIYFKSRPTKGFTLLFTLVGAVLLMLLSQELGLMLTMINLLVFTHVMKLYEQNNPRDFYTFNLLSFMVLATTMIFHQSVWFFALLLVLLMFNWLPLQFYRRGEKVSGRVLTATNKTRVKGQFGLIAKVVAISIPLAVLMFFVFPRLQPFSTVPLAKVSKTGLSDTVNVGDISAVAQSNELAFRVDFDNGFRPSGPMYWRALTMEYFDGTTWRGAEHNPQLKSSFANKNQYSEYVKSIETASQLVGSDISYQVYVQPSYQRWLFALNEPQPITSNILKLADNTLMAERPITQKMVYQVRSYPQARSSGTLSEFSRVINLALPEQINPKLLAHAQGLKQKYQDAPTAQSQSLRISADILRQFREQAFYYTLTPPLLFGDRLDQFFFDTRSGFCVHYASTYTFLMRAAGIPARMVTGYLGGELHSQGDFYSVYQKDAHAWSEIWIDGVGWQRVDPTAAVSPERVEQGVDQALSQEQFLLNPDFLSTSGLANTRFILEIQARLALVDYQWTKYIVGFNGQKQSRLMQKLFGQNKAWHIALLIAGGLVGAFILVYLFSLISLKRNKLTIEQKRFEQLKRLLEHYAIKNNRPSITSNQYTVRQFCLYYANEFPPLNDNLTAFYLAYEKMRYQPLSKLQYQNEKAQLTAFYKQLTEQFKQRA